MKDFTIPQLDSYELNRKTDLLALVERDTTLKKVAQTGSGEYAGSCPFCGGKDRFRLQLKAPPGKLPKGQRWMCRKCSDHWGDAVGYVMKREKCEFTQALKIMAGDNLPPARMEEQPTALEEPGIDRLAWTATAYSFIATAEKKLWQPEGEGALKYLHYRGLQDQTLKYWQIGYNPEQGFDNPHKWGFPPEEKMFIPKGIVIPCEDQAGLHYVKVRRKDADPKYWILRGGQMWPFGLQTYLDALTAFLFEGEFDCILAWQTGLGVGSASLPAGQELQPTYGRFFQTVEDVLVAYDSDEPGEKAAAKLAKLDHFHQARPLEFGKDLTDYFLLGGDVFEYIYQALEALPLGT